jgi:hypothetical protein
VHLFKCERSPLKRFIFPFDELFFTFSDDFVFFMLKFSGKSGDGGLLGWRFFRSFATISPDLRLGLA